MFGKTLAASLSAAVAALTLSACQSADLTKVECIAEAPRDTTITSVVSSDLVQRLTVSSIAPCPGEDITIQSELEVTTGDSVFITSRHCGLDLAGSLNTVLTPHIGVCLGYQEAATYASGAVIRSGTFQRVQSGPGNYTLEVRHSLTPSYWIMVPIIVRGE